ncbi:MAG: hypothetical protein IJV47_02820 [Candidatus Methanomethylophilaceae archaeon]|nr:hypothetical protein [Candidatus Methanomethylophilaceae archaeon]MBQ7979408.1 hypothetical protein [Candidatus Methanomethylophilaceae archaeon]MBQ9689528.1 hypothetical protein [Candidatus Methanomethylophilaceae archaeon]
MSQETPAEISAVGLDEWYASLNDMNKVKVKRYLNCIDTTSKQDFLVDLMMRSGKDSNYGLSVMAGQYALSQDLSDYDRFKVTEAYIDGLFGAEKFDELKVQCCNNLDLFPKIKDEFLDDNGGVLPKTIYCRNRLIDVMVGVDSDYEGATDALDSFAEIGIMDPDELAYRKQSLKIHRMQKTFDNVFSLRPKE